MHPPRHSERNSNQHGYSLIELMIVLAIIGVLALSVNFSYSPANSRLKQASRELYSNMQTARMEAAKRNENWGIICDNDTDTYALCEYDTVTKTCTGDNTTIDLDTYKSDVKFGYGEATKNATSAGTPHPFDEISYDLDSVYFDSKGLSPKRGYIYLKNNKNKTFAIATPFLTGNVVMFGWVCTTRDADGTCTDGNWE